MLKIHRMTVCQPSKHSEFFSQYALDHVEIRENKRHLEKLCLNSTTKIVL